MIASANLTRADEYSSETAMTDLWITMGKHEGARDAHANDSSGITCTEVKRTVSKSPRRQLRKDGRTMRQESHDNNKTPRRSSSRPRRDVCAITKSAAIRRENNSRERKSKRLNRLEATTTVASKRGKEDVDPSDKESDASTTDERNLLLNASAATASVQQRRGRSRDNKKKHGTAQAYVNAKDRSTMASSDMPLLSTSSNHSAPTTPRRRMRKGMSLTTAAATTTTATSQTNNRHDRSNSRDATGKNSRRLNSFSSSLHGPSRPLQRKLSASTLSVSMHGNSVGHGTQTLPSVHGPSVMTGTVSRRHSSRDRQRRMPPSKSRSQSALETATDSTLNRSITPVRRMRKAAVLSLTHNSESNSSNHHGSGNHTNKSGGDSDGSGSSRNKATRPRRIHGPAVIATDFEFNDQEFSPDDFVPEASFASASDSDDDFFSGASFDTDWGTVASDENLDWGKRR
ncbi:hypothetical protein IV203_025311 [Nitzschia inconspicua]|uniref:Uncharacterized protein n=1 Tax=Nitzschia inconspicua TaxID=303405 RepID=A0A9K3PC62_9STRA|nr:hypothetical protein IV203_024683 [Nitzschia inconspicua]KAG7362427.1 hypothetical protein IV203_025311 [Nitzschia inconspicua]